jgi:hypothetical protein
VSRLDNASRLAASSLTRRTFGVNTGYGRCTQEKGGQEEQRNKVINVLRIPETAILVLLVEKYSPDGAMN